MKWHLVNWTGHSSGVGGQVPTTVASGAKNVSFAAGPLPPFSPFRRQSFEPHESWVDKEAFWLYLFTESYTTVAKLEETIPKRIGKIRIGTRMTISGKTRCRFPWLVGEIIIILQRTEKVMYLLFHLTSRRDLQSRLASYDYSTKWNWQIDWGFLFDKLDCFHSFIYLKGFIYLFI